MTAIWKNADVLCGLLLGQIERDIEGLSIQGLIMMILSISLVTGLAIFCIHRILRSPQTPPAGTTAHQEPPTSQR